MFADAAEVSIHLLDMKMFLNKLYILAGAANAAHAPQMYYSIGKLFMNNKKKITYLLCYFSCFRFKR